MEPPSQHSMSQQQQQQHVRQSAPTSNCDAAAADTLGELPPISALFLIDFDVKAGYTIAWKRHLPHLELDNVVEYKSLPSGLHTVHEDLIYFVHDGHAGLSAFCHEHVDDAAARNARMIAVGVLVPLSQGRLGRTWRHAAGLKDLASSLVKDKTLTVLLEKYWATHTAADSSASMAPESPVFSPSYSPLVALESRRRDIADGHAAITLDHQLSTHHPAWRLTSLLDTFGPLIFPIYRAALLRKRILISCRVPIHEVCDHVYNISMLCNIPRIAGVYLPADAPHQRLRPLFAIGIHDIPLLENISRSGLSETNNSGHSEGWIACTADSILATKASLWDMLITMPAAQSSSQRQTDHTQAHVKTWPRVECSAGQVVKATQRDLRRFRTLQKGLKRLRSQHQHQQRCAAMSTTSTSPLLSPSSSATATSPTSTTVSPLLRDDLSTVAEPMSWFALAYTGFMWWASAGEQRRTEEADEMGFDHGLLVDLVQSQPRRRGSHPADGMLRHSQTWAGDSSDSGHAATTQTVMMEETEDTVVARTTGAAPGAHPASSVLASSGPTRRASPRRATRSQQAHHVTTSAATITTSNTTANTTATGASAIADDGDAAAAELAIITYFHRLTTATLRTLEVVNESAAAALGPRGLEQYRDNEEENSEEGEGEGQGEVENGTVATNSDNNGHNVCDTAPLLSHGGKRTGQNGSEKREQTRVRVNDEALKAMGLDVWSRSDKTFVGEMLGRYYGLQAEVVRDGVEICGLRLC